MTSPGNSDWPRYGLLLLLALLLFGHFTGNEFHFDDYSAIVNNPRINDPLTIARELVTAPLQLDRTFTELSFAVNHRIHGLWQPGYALVNILLHGANGCLVFFLLCQLLAEQDAGRAPPRLGRKTIPLLAAALFLAHPLAVNSVSYITQRHGLLMSFFYLAGFLCFLRYHHASGSGRFVYLIPLILCFLLGMHSKPNIITLPAVCLAYAILFPTGQAARHRVPKILVSGSAIIAVVGLLLYGYGDDTGLFSATDTTAGFATEHLGDPWTTFLTQSQIFHHYFFLLLFPLPQLLCADRFYPLVTAVNPLTIMAWIGHSAILGGAAWCIRTKLPVITFGILWLYLTLSPFLVLPIQDRMVEYRTYLPSIGFFICLAQLSSLLATRILKTRLLTGLGLLLLGLYAIAGWQRNLTMQTEISFWSDVIDKNPHQPRPYNNRGLAWVRLGHNEKAAADFNRAIQTANGYPLAYGNAGDIYLKEGKIDAAIQYYTMYHRIRPDDLEGLLRLGNGYLAKKEWNMAIDYYRQAMAIDDRDHRILYSLALAQEQAGHHARAITLLQQLLRLHPDHLQGNGNLGAILYRQGQRGEAKRYFVKALAIDPGYTPAIVNLIAYHAGMGELPAARRLARLLARYDQKKSQELLRLLGQTGVKDQKIPEN